MCGKYGANNAHHRRALSQGGHDRLSNLLLLCGSGITGCHGFITVDADGIRIGKRMGWIVRHVSEPADIPVWRFNIDIGERVLVRLDDAGDYQLVDDADVEQMEHLRAVTW